MNGIIKNLNEKNWPSIKKYIKDNKIDWDYLVDQTNGLLHYLAYHDKIDLIKLIDPTILSKIILEPNNEGDTICHIAAKLNNIELLNFSIKIDSNIIYYKNKLECTPLYYIAQNDKLIKNIVKSIEIFDHHLNNEYTLVEYYILTNNFSMVIFILNNITINKLTNEAIFTVIRSDNTTDFKIKLLDIFIEHGIDINILNNKFLSPLIVSIYQKEYEITKILLENGANPNYYGPENNDHPLTISIAQTDAPTLELLLEYDININIANKYLKTPVHYLFSVQNSIPVRIKCIILNKISSINSTDNRMDSIFIRCHFLYCI